MRTLEEQIEVTAPVGTAWSQLHRVAEYPLFVAGVVQASAHGRHHAHLDVEFGGERHAVDAELTDHGRGRVMSWETVDGPPLRGTFALRELDAAHTRVQLRLEYDPQELTESLGGPHGGYAQSHAVEEAVRADLELFKQLCEE
ncbi:SRPBCC family protein [Kitasatospora fiedleri]|uniref:SRPBCC family protein n=1 Tax=Kitasatospora fiedleri TaxID=2991545 RepID=UPI000C2C16DD|nr:SRPBCC family protein [Kitasatospora fiedleri]